MIKSDLANRVTSCTRVSKKKKTEQVVFMHDLGNIFSPNKPQYPNCYANHKIYVSRLFKQYVDHHNLPLIQIFNFQQIV
jgi:hypothetical protein